MRIITVAAAAIAGTLTAATLGLAGSAAAAPAGHYAAARADWKHGAHVPAAEQSRYWHKASGQLGAEGSRHTYERHDLATLISIPLTDATAEQRATETRVTRELNGFFRTSGLYGIGAGHPAKIARADWIRSAHVVAAHANGWLAATSDELAGYGSGHATARADLESLESIPLTSTTAKQRATAHRDHRALDTFFHTPNLHN